MLPFVIWTSLLKLMAKISSRFLRTSCTPLCFQDSPDLLMLNNRFFLKVSFFREDWEKTQTETFIRRLQRSWSSHRRDVHWQKSEHRPRERNRSRNPRYRKSMASVAAGSERAPFASDLEVEKRKSMRVRDSVEFYCGMTRTYNGSSQHPAGSSWFFRPVFRPNPFHLSRLFAAEQLACCLARLIENVRL